MPSRSQKDVDLEALEKLGDALEIIARLTGTDADLHPYVVSHLRQPFKRFSDEFGHVD
jgi:hypothetical protein